MKPEPSAPPRLLAKSLRQDGAPLTLQQHSLEAGQAAERLFRSDRRFARSWCRFFKVEDPDRFVRHVRVAALLHDLGKANEDFQAMVDGRLGQQLQCLRHEHLSALLLHEPKVRQWLTAGGRLDADVVTAAVLSHHFKASDGDGDHRWCQARRSGSLLLHFGHDEVRRVLGQVAEVAGLGEAPRLELRSWQPSGEWEKIFGQARDAANKFRRDLPRNVARQRLTLATKAGVIAADTVASAMFREHLSLERWIDEVVHREPIGPEEIDRAILQPRIRQIEAKAKKPFVYQRFQEEAAQLGPRALLLAACGAGKTMAAWRWAQAQAGRRSISNVVFLYPTRGTATEGFRDYVGWAPEGEGSLLHGTSAYELETLRENPPESLKGKQLVDEASARLFALQQWPKRYFSATVDQFFGFLEHHYGSTCLLPLLADAAVIVDETHSFDPKLFEGLVTLLRTFDVPVLCMTATLPRSRREQLVAEELEVYPGSADRERLKDLEQAECHPRYRLQRVADPDEAFERAVDAQARGSRVLWVVNQVRRAQELAQRLRQRLGDRVLCYHSRFRLKDRQERHRETVDAFGYGKPPRIAVATQVAEMSLDLDADVLITEVAPVTSLVQRFGRANRHLARGDAFRAEILFYDPEVPRPYTREDLAAANQFLEAVGTAEVSQRRLAELLEEYAPEEPDAEGSTRFLTSGYFAVPGALRDIDEFSHQAVLERDLAEVRAARKAREPLDGWVVPVPKKETLPRRKEHAWLPDYLHIAPSDRYDEALGFLVTKES